MMVGRPRILAILIGIVSLLPSLAPRPCPLGHVSTTWPGIVTHQDLRCLFF
jgi:hypothetical protein